MHTINKATLFSHIIRQHVSDAALLWLLRSWVIFLYGSPRHRLTTALALALLTQKRVYPNAKVTLSSQDIT